MGSKGYCCDTSMSSCWKRSRIPSKMKLKSSPMTFQTDRLNKSSRQEKAVVGREERDEREREREYLEDFVVMLEDSHFKIQASEFTQVPVRATWVNARFRVWCQIDLLTWGCWNPLRGRLDRFRTRARILHTQPSFACRIEGTEPDRQVD